MPVILGDKRPRGRVRSSVVFAVIALVVFLPLVGFLLMPAFGWEVSLGRGTALFGMKALPGGRWRQGFDYSANGPTYSLRVGDWVWVVEGDG